MMASICRIFYYFIGCETRHIFLGGDQTDDEQMQHVVYLLIVDTLLLHTQKRRRAQNSCNGDYDDKCHHSSGLQHIQC